MQRIVQVPGRHGARIGAENAPCLLCELCSEDVSQGNTHRFVRRPLETSLREEPVDDARLSPLKSSSADGAERVIAARFVQAIAAFVQAAQRARLYSRAPMAFFRSAG